MKVEHKTIKELQQKDSNLNRRVSYNPGVSQVSTGTSIETSNTWFKWKPRISLFTGVRMENQQFGDEHGLGLNDAGVESVEVIKGPFFIIWFRCAGWCFIF
jgi:iron complex outermembrane receptor protein